MVKLNNIPYILLLNFLTNTQAFSNNPDTSSLSAVIKSNSVSAPVMNKSTAEKNKAIQQIREYSLAGKYENAESALIQYQKNFGEDNAYYLEKARFLTLTNHSTHALSLVNILLEKNPSDLELKNIKQYALEHPDKVTKTDNTEKTKLINQIRNYSIAGDYKSAETNLSAYKVKYGEDDAYLKERARFLALTNQSKEALVILDGLIQKNPTDNSLNAIKQYAVAHPNPGPIPTPTVTKSSDLPVLSQQDELAVQAVNKGDYKNAALLFQKSLETNPNDKVAFLGLARMFLLQEQYEKGRAQLDAYKKKFGVDTNYQIEYARYFALTNHGKQALDIIEPLQKKDPTNTTLLDIKKYALSHLDIVQPHEMKKVSPLQHAKVAEKFAKSRQTDPDLYVKAAQAYLLVKDQKRAAIMVDKALALAPSNSNIITLRAEIASSLGEYELAYQLDKQVYKANQNNTELLLALARAAGRAGRLDKSASYYKIYLKKVPNDGKAWLEYAYIQSWRGNDRMAIRALDSYYALFGNTKPYLIEKARIVASADRPREALAIIRSFLPELNTNYDLNFAATTAYFYNDQPVEMFKSLEQVKQLKPNANETIGLNKFVRTPYRSNVSIEGFHSQDTDSVGITTGILSGQWFLSPVTSILASATEEQLAANLGSGLTPINGGEDINLSTYNLGLNYRYNPVLGFQGLIGDALIGNSQQKFIYQGDAFIQMTDTSALVLQSKRKVYDLSALAVSLNVMQNLNQVVFTWKPCIQCYLVITPAYSTFTDTNTMKFINAGFGANLIATQWYNFKLGFTGTRYGFSKQLSNGYYSPSDYRYRALVASLYVKQSESVGYDFTVGLGFQKDETFTTYKPANDYSARAYLGIYNDWYLTLSAGFSTRGRAIGNNPTLGDYQVYALDAKLTRRFN